MPSKTPDHSASFDPARLCHARARAGMTLAALGKDVECSHTQIAHFEKGRRTPDGAMVRKLARALGVRPEDLAAASRVKVLERMHPLSPAVLDRDVRRIDALVHDALDTAVRAEPWTDTLLLAAMAFEEFGTIGLCESWEVEPLAKAFRERLGFGQQAVHDLIVGLEGLGVLPVELIEPTSFRAALYRAEVPGPRVVLAIRASLSATDRRAAMAEAIGRSLIQLVHPFVVPLAQWWRTDLQRRRIYAYEDVPTEAGRLQFEAMVQRFGRAFLAPQAQVRALIKRYHPEAASPMKPAEALLVAYHFGLSTDKALLRLHDLRFVDDERLREMRRMRLPDPPVSRTERPLAALKALLHERMGDT